MSQLTDQQIESLYKFTRQHFVEYYDLQTELVDHMANGIDQQWNENTNLTFEQARDREFKKFGVFGFMDVLEQRQKAMSKKYAKIVWQHFKDYMRLPKILGFVLSILIAYTILKYTSVSEEFFLGAIVTSAIIYISATFYRRKQIKKTRVASDKKWMFEDIIFSQAATGGVALIPLHFYNIFGRLSGISEMNSVWILILSMIICSFYLFLYIMTVEIPQMADEYLEQTYPEYRMV
ncbi:hypothetical protein [Nonlabens marinus]|uniref:Uncharacterized protein n=1 Tax=Nonlabens marinus S1-08 TaxID=1454201 RepID=W8VSK7_9FLAO|nr:hypothetical protein [Nonlabens marinus]BAO56285.1 hypothetical protein NMS_2276 [Nonlabens marinus S1-08]